MKIHLLIFCFTILSISGFSQESTVSIDSVKFMEVGDTLSIRYENIGCRVKYVSQYFIYKKNDSFELMYYDVPNSIKIDWKFINDFKDREKFMQEDAQNHLKPISIAEIENLLKDFEFIIETNNDSVTIAAGSFSYLFIKLKSINIEKEFKGWIELEGNVE